MPHVTSTAPAPAQQRRLESYAATESVDVHCHCLPGLDDGPTTLDEALGLCRALVADGVTTAIATPHQLGRFDGHVAASAIRQAVAALALTLDEQGIPLRVVPGADVRVDERIPALLDAGSVLTLADSGKYLLLELPHETLLNIAPLLAQLTARGVTPILSHPERNPLLAREPNTVFP
ncbi:MAG TPA: tyrosine protein kinase, partial [Planctomycetota bacterium]|nr:tyrosine protein kinase [Planctomycetota bacterium]